MNNAGDVRSSLNSMFSLSVFAFPAFTEDDTACCWSGKKVAATSGDAEADHRTAASTSGLQNTVTLLFPTSLVAFFSIILPIYFYLRAWDSWGQNFDDF